MSSSPSTPQVTRHSDTRRAWLLRAMVLWGIFTVSVSIKTIVSPDEKTVFPKCAARAVGWWSDRPLYEPFEGHGRFPYSPTFAIGFTPFALLGHCLGGIVWSSVNIAVYVLGLRRLVRDVFPVESDPRWEGTVLMVAMIGAIRGLWNAQSNALIIGLLMLGLSAVAGKRWWWAAVLMAISTYVKVWPMVIPLLVMALWPREFSLRFFAAMLVGALIPFLTRAPGAVVQQYSDWFEFLSRTSTEVVGPYRDLWTVSNLIGAPVNIVLYRCIQLGTGATVLGACLWYRVRVRDDRLLLTLVLAAGTGWLMIFGPAVEYNTFVVLAPALTWMLLQAIGTHRGRPLAIMAFLTIMLLGAGAVERLWRHACPWAVTTLPVGTAIFVLWLLLYFPRPKRAS